MPVIVLQSHAGEHFGFMLIAGDRQPFDVGQWKSQCVFIAVPTDARLLDDEAFLQLAEHRYRGEHQIAGESYGQSAELRATSDIGVLFVKLTTPESGEWGVSRGDADVALGKALLISKDAKS